MKIFLTIYFFTFYAQAYYIDLGFALKPFFILSFFIFLFLYKEIKISFHNYEIFLFIFLMFYILTSFVSEDYMSSLRMILGIVMVFSIYILLKYLFSKIDNNPNLNLEKILINSFSFFLIISLILYIMGMSQIDTNYWLYNEERIFFGVIVDRSIPRIIGMTSDPNFFALYCTPMFFYLYLKNQKSKKEFLLLFLTLFAIILTFSRGGIIAIFLIILIQLMLKGFSLLVNKNKLISLKKVLSYLILTIITLGIIIYLSNVEFIVEIIEKRMRTSNTGSGRFEIWTNGLSLFYDNCFIGIGIYNFQYYNNLIFNDGHYMHNTHLEMLVESGIIGFTLYFLFLLLLLIELVKLSLKNNKYIYLLFSYISILVHMIGLSAIINEIWILFLAFTSFIIQKGKRRLNARKE